MPRIEHDVAGALEIPDNALYGVHALRASLNFPVNVPFHREWYQALGMVKSACYLTVRDFLQAGARYYPGVALPAAHMGNAVLDALIAGADDVAAGKHYDHFIVPAICGGAGTSINMNINEIIANVALKRLGHAPGAYGEIDPLDHANIFQSTNDVVPTALRLAVMHLLEHLEQEINQLRQGVEKLENEHRHTVRTAFTQMAAAAPTTYGRLFSTYSEALSRDWWRMSRCMERVKVVNLGGNAVGSGLTVPRYFIFEVVKHLRQLSGKPLTRGENLADVTSNQDELVETHGMLKTHAVNLEKLAADIRLLASDIAPEPELTLPARQISSSIMPHKRNPVINEFIISCCHRVYGNDTVITSLAGQGCLELNAYLPAIGHSLMESLKLLIAANQSLYLYLIKDLTVHKERARRRLHHHPGLATALVPHIGYHKASRMAACMKKNRCSIFMANNKLNLVEPDLLQRLMQAESLQKLGFSLSELTDSTED